VLDQCVSIDDAAKAGDELEWSGHAPTR
jgi:hypothetical protein